MSTPILEDEFECTELQVACRKGLLEDVRALLENGSDIDVGPDTALHIALRKRNTAVAIALLQAGADFELKDSRSDCAIHIAANAGLLDVVQVLCALGCSIEVADAKGLYPLHLAARNGHTHIVRCLCAAGCNIDIRNSDNIRADITALKYGHNDIAELLDRLRASGQRDVFARQLIPTNKPLARLTLRVLGHCGVGKTALIKSLGAGLFSSLFRRSSSLQSNKSRPSSPINTQQIEMDVTSRQNSLTFEATANYQSTKGVQVQQLDISNVGEVTVWEFSGQESYFPVYHHFLGPNSHCLSCVLFSLEESFAVQLQQVSFWINFMLARQIVDLSAEYGQILLVATHVDTTRAVRNAQGEWISPDAQRVLSGVHKLNPYIIPNVVCPTVLVLDGNVPAAYPFKVLKATLAGIKHDQLHHTVLMGTGLLEATLTWLVTLRKDREFFPVLTRHCFAELLRAQVNLLASDEHIRELLQTLDNFGEVFCVSDLVIISVNWLCYELLGELLSAQFIGQSRITGVYSPDDFQAAYNCCDALELLKLLDALHLCIQCDVEGDVEYEFPCYNQIETLPGLWDAGHPTYRVTGACYGGIRLRMPSGTCYLLTALFSHIQIELRRETSQHLSTDSDTDLYQWCQGSKLCAGALESLITLNTSSDSGKQYIEVKVRGPRDTAKSCLYFITGILDIIDQTIATLCPGLLIERFVISAHQLRVHCAAPHCYPPNVIAEALLDAESTLDVLFTNPDSGKQESVVQLLLFDCEELLAEIQWGCSLNISHLSAPARLRLCGLLDPPEPRGCDWCLLGLRLGLGQERIAALDSVHTSHTMHILTMANCTIGALVTNLHELERQDAAEVVLRSAPLFSLVVAADVAEA